jgi:SUMO ligase MMS21 Smc5/6 complex component
MVEKIKQADENLEVLLQLLAQIKSKNINQILDIDNSRQVDIERDVQRIAAVYQEQQEKFDAMKKNNEESVQKLKNQLVEDRKKLEGVTNQKSLLEAQVENLETISASMPNWCQSESNVAELGDSRRKRPKPDIMEQA